MFQFGCRPRNLSFIFVIVLVLSNILLTFLLLLSETCIPFNTDKELDLNFVTEWNLQSSQKDDIPEKLCPQQDELPKEDDILKLNIQLGRWDSKRLYKTFDSILVGDKYIDLSKKSKVCLATQTSVEKLHSLVPVVYHWSGPISISIFVAGDEEFQILQKYLIYLKKCYEPIKNQVTFSLTIPKSKLLSKQPNVFDMPENSDCSKPEATLNSLLSEISEEQLNWRISNVYPQNHMRNLARKNCQSDYVFLTDVDIVPSHNMAVVLEEFLLADNCEKCAYVIPTYELVPRVRFPQNKSELIYLAEKGLARPFHQKVFIYSHFATNYSRWAMDVNSGNPNHENLKNGKIYISHDVTNFEFLYEPFYVAKDTVPSHDERFMGYGYTRNSQVYEMHVSGYKFKVLSPIFTIHWGLQTEKSRPSWREKQNNDNRKQVQIFKKEIFAKYMHRCL
ncbi:beta-1,4-glucuronyltransferase 1-like [Leptopilina boulardi]|uniref:beta-1,4-glucuronyltransferase 1-like n=1 Tax=Leptopilina boulardi TaxID=63433 RepID=UPI0021F522D4|nr:beta-1,4-glucuronyltransferase 1-like [Leptopilina boulardi]